MPSAILLLFMFLLTPQSLHAGDATGILPADTRISNVGFPVGTIITWPSGSWPKDREKWLECDGSSTAGYPLLQRLGYSRTPDLNGRFLRGGDSGVVGSFHDEVIISHELSIPSHKHNFVGGKLSSTAITGVSDGQSYQNKNITFNVTGTADGQDYSSNGTLTTTGTAAGQKYQKTLLNSGGSSSKNIYIRFHGEWVPVYGKGGSDFTEGEITHRSAKATSSSVTGKASGSYTLATKQSNVTSSATKTVEGVTDTSTVSGNVDNKNVSGTISETDEQIGRYRDGGDETVPDYTYVRYLIRARI